jgi:hypothetical protein
MSRLVWGLGLIGFNMELTIYLCSVLGQMCRALPPLPYIMNMLVSSLCVSVLHRIVFRETFYTVTVITTLNVAITSICLQTFPLSVESLISDCDLLVVWYHLCCVCIVAQLVQLLSWMQVSSFSDSAPFSDMVQVAYCLSYYHHTSTYPVNGTDCCAICCMLPLLQVMHRARRYSACKAQKLKRLGT